jgi:hypothetical protein
VFYIVKPRRPTPKDLSSIKVKVHCVSIFIHQQMTFKLMIDYYDTDNYVVIAVVIIHIIEGLLTWH